MKFRFVRVILFIIICIAIISITSCDYKNQSSEQITDVKIEVEYGENEEESSVVEDDNSTDNTIYVEMEVKNEHTDEYIEDEAVEEIEEAPVETEELVSLGQFTLTAYCSCVRCCGQYAYGRPVDENGNEIVHGAIGETLISGVSIAVDPYVIPFYTEVVMNGKTYIAHDTGGLIKGNRIDVYFDNHEEACAFGLQYAEVFIKK